MGKGNRIEKKGNFRPQQAINDNNSPVANSKKKHYVRRSPYSCQPNVYSNELRPVFAAYLNMARANLFAVLRHISILSDLPVNGDEEHMEKLSVARFANQKHPEVRQKVFTLLFKYIPCLKQMSQAYITKAKPARDGKSAVEEHKALAQADLQELLQNIIRVINFHRNDFTHAAHYNKPDERNAEFRCEAALFRPINTAFMGSKRETSRIFQYSAQDMFFVDQGERMERTSETNEDGKPIYREYDDWYFRLYTKNPKYIRNDKGELEIFTDIYSGETDSLQLTAAGLTFLICKLLHKKYATQLAQQSGLFRHKSQSGCSPFSKRENEVMFNIFCAHRIRLPKGRILSSANRSALGLDMLNELQKCPKELFETFSPQDRKMFQLAHKNEDRETMADDDINLFRRDKDRFTTLALKYIDSFRDGQTEHSETHGSPLPTIVFQIALGKYRYKFYNRASLDTEEEDRVRVLQKEINGFGSIFKIEELRDGEKDVDNDDNVGNLSEGKYSSLIRRVNSDQELLYDPDTATTKPYLTDHHASYAITGERIGLMWGTKKENGILCPNTLCYLPNLPEPVQNPDGSWSVDKLKIDNNVVPRAWLSIYDLPALIFLHLLGGKPEEVIKEKYKNLKKLFNDVEKNILKPIYEEELDSDLVKRQQQIDNPREKLGNLLQEKYKGLVLKDIPHKIIEYLTIGVASGKDTIDEQFVRWVNEKLEGYSEKKDSEGHIIVQAYKGMIKSLKDRMDKFDKDINTIGDKQNRIGRKSYVDVRPGSLARYLSKDIVRMTIPNYEVRNGGKPTGLDFAVLQSSIATFVGNGKKLKDTSLGKILQKAIIISNHPFLEDIMEMQVKDAIDLYRKYQSQKLKWLKDRSEKKDYLENAHFMYFMREAYRNFMAKDGEKVKSHDDDQENHVKGLAERYPDTMQLPDGLFTDSIRKQLASNDDTKDNPYIKAALNDEKCGHSAAYLLYVYFTHVLNDKSQPFYRNQGKLYKRHYKLLNTLFPNPDGDTYFDDSVLATKLKKNNGKLAPIRKAMDDYINRLQMQVGKRYDPERRRKVAIYAPADEKTKKEERIKLMRQLRDLQRNEQSIRRYRNEDMLLFLMAKDLLLAGGNVFKDKAKSSDLQKSRLQDIMPPAFKSADIKSILEQPINFSFTIGLNDEQGIPIRTSNGKQIIRTIHQNGIKLKNYGDFFAFLYDTRIGGLLSQMSDKIIERQNLEEELDNYDRKRLKVFAVLQAIERRIIKEHPELADSNVGGQGFCDTDGKPYRNSFSGLLSLCKQYLATEEKEKVLNELGYGIVDIRNAFSHNRYTSSDNKKIVISKMSLPQVAELILKWLEDNK